MKKTVAFVMLSLTLVTCQESVQQSHFDKTMLRDVGRAITAAEADRWSSRAAASSARQHATELTIGKENLRLLLAHSDDFDGLFFYHGLESQDYHVFAMPYTKSENFWQNNMAVDANVDGIIESPIAKAWADAFMSSNPDVPRSHFFGRNLMENILAKDDFQKIEIRQGINDSGHHVLLLYAWSVNPLNGRLKQEAEVFDHANPCPHYCPQ